MHVGNVATMSIGKQLSAPVDVKANCSTSNGVVVIVIVVFVWNVDVVRTVSSRGCLWKNIMHHKQEASIINQIRFTSSAWVGLIKSGANSCCWSSPSIPSCTLVIQFLNFKMLPSFCFKIGLWSRIGALFFLPEAASEKAVPNDVVEQVVIATAVV